MKTYIETFPKNLNFDYLFHTLSLEIGILNQVSDPSHFSQSFKITFTKKQFFREIIFHDCLHNTFKENANNFKTFET